MKTNQMLTFAAALLTLFAACKKEETSTPAARPATTCRMTKVTNLDSFDCKPRYTIRTYEYDNSSRIIKQIVSGGGTGSGDQTTVVTYTGNTIIANATYPTIPNYYKQTAILNGAGYATAVYGENFDYPHGIMYDTTYYEYDANNYRTKMMQQRYTPLYSTTLYTYANGDVASEVITSTNGDVSTTLFQYDMNRTALSDPFNPIIKTGKYNTHLLKSFTTSSSIYTPSRTDVTYQFNSDGYPTKRTDIITYPLAIRYADVLFEYFCN